MLDCKHWDRGAELCVQDCECRVVWMMDCECWIVSTGIVGAGL